MQRARRWDPCVSHRGDDVSPSFADYFAGKDRNVLLIAGAGFDPRATQVAEKLGKVCKAIRAVWLKEQRPDPAAELVTAADANLAALNSLIPSATTIPFDIFQSDGAVVGGRGIVMAMSKQDFEDVTDIVVDLSACRLARHSRSCAIWSSASRQERPLQTCTYSSRTTRPRHADQIGCR